MHTHVYKIPQPNPINTKSFLEQDIKFSLINEKDQKWT